MTHNQKIRREALALLPKFCQPKATLSRQLTTSIYHWDVIGQFAQGQADAQTVWAWAESALVYSEMTRRFVTEGVPVTNEAVAAIDEQLDAVYALIGRFKNNGRTEMTDAELAAARAAAHVMDQLMQPTVTASPGTRSCGRRWKLKK